MLILVLTTGTFDTEKITHSIACLGQPTHIIKYDEPGFDIVSVGSAAHYDVAIWIGAPPNIHPNVPGTEALCRLNRAVPTIHLCCDGGSSNWWAFLEEYEAARAFRLQVSIDGCWDTPLARFGRVDLTPIDPGWFPEADRWVDRPYACGFVGAAKDERPLILEQLDGNPLFVRLCDLSYAHLCCFYTLCRTVWNDARISLSGARHVKGRFIEAAMAGAVVLESADSPAQDWFKPGIDYLTWGDAEDVLRHARASQMQHIRRMAALLRAKVRQRCAPLAFWARTFAAAGIG